jgi:hypothetical protein
MADFLQTNATDEIDLDRAASAFPDISLDGSTDIPLPSIPSDTSLPAASSFAWDDISTTGSAPAAPDVKVTGGDEVATFVDQFPDIEVPSAQVAFPLLCFRCAPGASLCSRTLLLRCPR